VFYGNSGKFSLLKRILPCGINVPKSQHNRLTTKQLSVDFSVDSLPLDNYTFPSCYLWWRLCGLVVQMCMNRSSCRFSESRASLAAFRGCLFDSNDCVMLFSENKYGDDDDGTVSVVGAGIGVLDGGQRAAREGGWEVSGSLLLICLNATLLSRNVLDSCVKR